jgi:hypothetical protein
MKVVKLLLKRGAAAAVTDNGGYTPAELATRNSHARVAALLKERCEVELEEGEDEAVAVGASSTSILRPPKILLPLRLKLGFRPSKRRRLG